MSTTEVLGVLGFCLGVLNTAITIFVFIYKERKEANQHREKVTATVSYNVADAPEMRVEVYNPSPTLKILAEQVQLKYRGGAPAPNPQAGGFRFEHVEDAIPLRSTRPITYPDSSFTTNGTSEEIEPLRRAEFFLPAQPVLSSIAELPPKDVWISISSAGGEIGRIDGERVVPILRMVVHRMESGPNTQGW